MKKISFLLIAGVLASLISSAQLHIIRKHGGNVLNDSTVVIFGLSSGILTDSLYVINTSSSAVNVNVRRDIISQVTGSDNYFCWYLTCFSPAVDSSYPDEAACPIPAGDTNKTFYCDYNPGGNVGTSIIRYTFMNASDRADTSWVSVKYTATLSGIASINNPLHISAPYPNPASEIVNFNYKTLEPAQLSIYNMLGQCIQTMPLSVSRNIASVNVSTINSGIYICKLEAEGSQAVVQKLIVSH